MGRTARGGARCIVATLGVALATVAGAGAQTVDVRAGSGTAVAVAPGTTLAVPIVLDISNAGAVNIAALQAAMSWSTARLTFDSVRVAPVPGWTITPATQNVASGALSFTASSGAALAATSTLANAYFTANATLGGTRVAIAPASAGDATLQDILPFIRAQSLDVCVGPTVKWGDVTDNGATNIIDAQQIARFAVGLDVTNPTATAERGDVTADTLVNIIDAQQIARFSVGLPAAPRIATDFVVMPKVTSIGLSPGGAQNMVVGSSMQLHAAPVAGAVDLAGCSGALWQSSDPGVATVNGSGYVTAVAAGSATITTTSADNSGFTAAVSVTSTGNPAQLAVATQPSGAEVGARFITQPVVEVRYVTGYLDAAATTAVTATITSGNGTLLGTATVNAAGGIATFTTLRIDAVGDKQITFSAAGLRSAVSATFPVATALSTASAVPAVAGTKDILIPAFTPVSASGGQTPYAFALSGGTLPAGMNLDGATGTVSGTPTAPLTATTFTMTVTDAAGATSAKTFSLTVNPPVVATQAVASKTGTNGTAIAPFVPVTAAGGTAPYGFALTGGTLPAGMNFNGTNGQVDGTPTTVLAATPFTVTITDAVGAVASKTFTLTVNPSLATTQAIASKVGTINTAIAPFIPVTASAGTAPYTYALSGAALPAGMNFDMATGTVSGTPTALQLATTYTVTATDAAGATSSKTFTLTVNNAVVAAQAVASTVGVAGHAFTAFTPVTASGGTPPYDFAISGTALPAGVNLDANTGAVTGTPVATLAQTTFTVLVTDAAGATSTNTFALTVNAPLSTTQVIASRAGTVNTAIPSFTPVTASNGLAPYSYALTGGSLPTGMNFNTSTGQVSGTPGTALAATVFTVTATDAIAATSAKTFTLTVNPALVATQSRPTVALTSGTAVTPFIPITASGGTPAYSYALSGGALPTGMNFSTSTGTVSGTPSTTLGTTTFTVTVTDAAGATMPNSFALTVNPALTTTLAIASKAWTINVPLAPFTPVTASAGTAPYTFAVTSGTLPSGLNLNASTGEISGTPTSLLAASAITVTATDAANATSFQTFTLTINGPVTTSQDVASTEAQIGNAVTPFTPVSASGGTAPYNFAITSGALPPGMSIDAGTGAISGTPTTMLANTTFTVTATDAASATSSSTFDLKVNGIVLAMTSAAMQSVSVDGDITIPLLVDMSNRGTDDLASITLTVTWDPAKFTYQSSSAGTWAGAAFFANEASTASGTLSLTGFTPTGATSDFTLYNVVLRAKTTTGPATVSANVSASGKGAGSAIVLTTRNVTVTINP